MVEKAPPQTKTRHSPRARQKSKPTTSSNTLSRAPAKGGKTYQLAPNQDQKFPPSACLHLPECLLENEDVAHHVERPVGKRQGEPVPPDRVASATHVQ